MELQRYRVTLNNRIFLSIAVEHHVVIATDEKDAGEIALTRSPMSNPWVDKVEEVKGLWHYERSSGYAGYRCQKCAEWIYEGNPFVCKCDKN